MVDDLGDEDGVVSTEANLQSIEKTQLVGEGSRS